MVGIGFFILYYDIIFKDYKYGDLEKILFMFLIIRFLFLKVLLFVIIVLVFINFSGRNVGFLVGCNVIMLNFFF